MNVTEVEQFHALAITMDPERIKPMDDEGIMAQAWQMILEDVPFGETRAILKKLYGRPQMLVLQPGHIVEAWEQVQQDRKLAAFEEAVDCPAHEGEKLPHCKACRSEVLTGERRRDQVGTIIPCPAEPLEATGGPWG